MNNQRIKRQIRSRKKTTSFTDRPRLSVFRSNQYCYAQVIDREGTTLFGLTEKNVIEKNSALSPVQRAKQLGSAIAKLALQKKIKTVVFDKGRYAYHGRVKAIADGAREGGLVF